MNLFTPCITAYTFKLAFAQDPLLSPRKAPQDYDKDGIFKPWCFLRSQWTTWNGPNRIGTTCL